MQKSFPPIIHHQKCGVCDKMKASPRPSPKEPHPGPPLKGRERAAAVRAQFFAPARRQPTASMDTRNPCRGDLQSALGASARRGVGITNACLPARGGGGVAVRAEALRSSRLYRG
jgi:hypothetical protein